MNIFLSSLKIGVFSILVLGLQACSTLVATPQPFGTVSTTDPIPENKNNALQAWARVLQNYVNDSGFVDFAGLSRNPADLHSYVRYISQTKATNLEQKNERLAHYINSYNALSMFNVISSNIPQSNAGLFARYQFFIARKHIIGGEPISLFAYENDIIRQLNEPRIHWALNCSAVSCPALPREPFDGARLEEQLEREAKRFFAQPRNMRIDHPGKTVYLSEIFDFFPEDFVPAHAPSLLAYANRYAVEAADLSYRTAFTPYDWTIANWQR